jgi:hypothetical protein
VPASRTEERHPATSWVCHSVGCDGGMQMTAACFNRRMRKTARPVVWKSRGGEIPSTPSNPRQPGETPSPSRLFKGQRVGLIAAAGKNARQEWRLTRHEGRPWGRRWLRGVRGGGRRSSQPRI